MDIWRKDIPGKGTRECTGPERGACLASESNREETNVAGAGGVRKRVVGARSEREPGARSSGALSTWARASDSL